MKPTYAQGVSVMLFRNRTVGETAFEKTLDKTKGVLYSKNKIGCQL